MPLKDGDFVLINYTVKVVEDGSERVIDTTLEEVAKKSGIYDPKRVYKEFPVIVGRTSLLGPLEKVLRELDVGERREVEVPPEEAFGEYKQELIVRVPVKRLRRMNIPVRVGEEVEAGGRRGKIIRVTERFAYIDFNHPLAGKKLKIEVEVVGKIDSPEEKARILAARALGMDPDKIQAEVSEGGKEVKVKLPPEALGLSDLDALLAKAVSDIREYLAPRKVDITISIEFPEETVEQASSPEEAGEGEGEGASGEEQAKQAPEAGGEEGEQQD
ncbi:FKBP-type peptidyl-prolyl cis-trans isomerase [Aeropyrum camini]|uniref:Peptidyl-prolyl cis-trans isomerase n=1 Tax=Aeropyrum camini SY1 = JCM 12091 TaxID=1198449 RepID=U3TD19_9CREN|nr:peptidylprolyl isomerase [Aeropyrum camini]BAN89868.1 FKBP-type peptidyl-prolyl cis-trans isomerase [Aeropyrum camini SY1 = JCM 12091]